MTFDIRDRTRTAAINKLRRARKKVEKKWAQGYFVGTDGGVCVLGALEYGGHNKAMVDRRNFITGQYNKDTVALKAIECSITKTKRYRESSQAHRGGDYWIETWNDHTSTTKRQVLQAFDRAIKILEHEKLC